MKPRSGSWGPIAAAVLLAVCGLLLLVDPALSPPFVPAGALHGPVPFDAASPLLVRVHGAVLMLIGLGIGLSVRARAR